ncbi:biosynthetic arginine decarboxylase [Alteromonas sp. KS69]|uniref:Arginine decarboxylase n=1 Tax=Alteromonas naphthalenivorans TaxID=715451 RepID=F5Z6U3_ALTNA|nr:MULTISPECIES: biosynthetic arginine decarboxylase [Alteromonas]AEF05606.1 arginine decarboxylase [Alteromonas naphthalenivorans]MBO7921199.1 biosynthetic arginine decarboxylase [Alteromonas sp. K632G]MCQ8848730.1 biosynthetic arginine decarboxylase [Alteromonas stellipolaris]RUP75174.1 biosynthetic arginine decarboxylase [Alteromonas sp. KS69]VEL98894.1 arginine decarboxylase [Alteromonas sp. 76-1]
MSDWSIEEAERVYGVSQWGGGYFQVGENGNVHVTPVPDDPSIRIDFKSVVEEIRKEGVQFPVVVRFHDILRSQVASLNKAFRSSIEEAEYKGLYQGVYPVKVNQMREVVEEIVEAGAPFNYGLEAGSKAELLTVLAMNTNEDSLTILNGYKDDEFMRLALLGRKLGRKIVVVVEKYSELLLLVKVSKELNIDPIIGVRAKMTVKGRGKWESSGGERAKFGLTITEIIKTARYLEEQGMSHCLKLLHFHIGSQLTDIRAVKEAMTEGARIYADLHKMGFPLDYVDVGGGLGIDYDGSNSTNESSRNYSMQEYVADVVYGMKEMCDLEGVPHPNLVSESGRAITAHHSCVVTEIVGEIKSNAAQIDTSENENEHVFLKNMRELSDDFENQTNMHEVYNDASQYKEQALGAFKLRVLSLEELAKIETLYWDIMARLQVWYRKEEYVPEELQELDYSLSSQYLCNFSVFQSAADTWAIDQLLPVVPLTRMNEKPTVNCSLVDITCDSDGKIDQFSIGREITDVLPMHPLKKDEPYYIGLFLTGAYQDVMGDMHNLFGRLNEVHIFSYDDDPEDFYIEEVVKGSSVEDVLNIMQYNPRAMASDVKRLIDRQVSGGKINPKEGVRWTDFYENCLSGYTYLKP